MSQFVTRNVQKIDLDINSVLEDLKTTGGATRVDWGGLVPAFSTEINFIIRPNPMRKGGGYGSGIKSRNIGLAMVNSKINRIHVLMLTLTYNWRQGRQLSFIG